MKNINSQHNLSSCKKITEGKKAVVVLIEEKLQEKTCHLMHLINFIYRIAWNPSRN